MEDIRDLHIAEYEYSKEGVQGTGQRRLYVEYDESGTEYVQAFINNISFLKSLDELEFFIDEHGRYNVEEILGEATTEWTTPRWAKIGDIVFFMHAKGVGASISRLNAELKRNENRYSPRRLKKLYAWLDRARVLYKQYGGKIFAIGRVCGAPYYDNPPEDSIYHWSSRYYAAIDRIVLLDKPVDISLFRDFIQVSRQSAITPVLGDAFDTLREVIKKDNGIPSYLENSISSPVPLTRINDENWIALPAEYRRRFLLEAQFRSYYVDHLLKGICDHRKRVYSECRCKKTGIPDSFVDNVIVINRGYLPVEVKLSIYTQSDMKGQVRKYTNDDAISCNEILFPIEKVYGNKVLIVDTDSVYIYDSDRDSISSIYSLDDLHDPADLQSLRKIVIDHL